MINRIHISNFLLIDHLELELNAGFTTITGETGAGKSILLGALGLVLGNRADLSQVKNNEKKCIVEVSFTKANENVSGFFEREDFDFDQLIILRREISPSGKSRAFINDTPASLSQLKELGEYLVDLHSQFANLEIRKRSFLFFVIDVYSGNQKLLAEYQKRYEHFLELTEEIKRLEDEKRASELTLDYNSFLLNEIIEVNPQPNELEDKEEELQLLSHAEEIQNGLKAIEAFWSGEKANLGQDLKQLFVYTKSISKYSSKLLELSARVESLMIELNDIEQEYTLASSDVEIDEEKLFELRERINQLNLMLYKHQALNTDDLISKKEELEKKVAGVEQGRNILEELLDKRTKLVSELADRANVLHQNRVKQAKKLEEEIQVVLHELGMPHAKVTVQIKSSENMDKYGKDHIQFLFSANKGMELQEISKAVSGGELSRFMLVTKSILSRSTDLPTIIFDEIDTGISGEIGFKMGEIIRGISNEIQVVAITHLPQVAAKGNVHLKVYKEDRENKTFTSVRKLNNEERILELAKMLSGEQISKAATENAKELLEN